MFSITKFSIWLSWILLCSCSTFSLHQPKSCQTLFNIREKFFGETSFLTARSANELGECYYHNGNYNDAEIAYQRAQSIYKKLGKENSSDFAKTIANLGVIYHAQGRYEEAEKAYEYARNFWKTDPTSSEYILATNNLGAFYNEQGYYVGARRLLQESLSLSKSSSKKERQDVILTNLALLSRMLGEYDQAKQYYQQALKVQSDTFKDQSQIALIKNHLALLYYLQSDYIHAQQLAEEVLNIQQHIPNKNDLHFASNLTTLARIHRDQGHYDYAESLFKQAQVIYKKGLNPLHPYIAFNLNEWAKLYQSQGDYTKAEELINEALFIITKTYYPELLWRIQDNLSQLLATQEQINAAILFGKQAISTIQTMRKQFKEFSKSEDGKALQLSFLEDKMEVYRRLADLLIEQERLPEALQVLTMLKEEEYLDFTFSTRGLPNKEIELNKLEQVQEQHYKKIKSQLIDLTQEYKQLRTKEQQEEKLNESEKQRFKELEQELEIAEKEFLKFLEQLKTDLKKDDIKPSNVNTDELKILEETLAKLGTGTVLIHYIVMSDKLNIILTTPQITIPYNKEVNRAKLNGDITEFILKIKNKKNILEIAQEFYKLLIEPIAKDLEKIQAKVLMVYLDGTLRYLPLAALHDGNQWLVERYALAIYNTAANINLTSEAQFKLKVAGLGTNKGSKEREFEEIPKTEDELENIIYHDTQDKNGILKGTIYFNDNFNKETLNEAIRKFPIIHIASHFRAGRNDEDSFLFLGNGNIFTLSNFKTTPSFKNKNSDLFVLSACETAKEYGSGNEVEGLATVIQKRNVKSVLATLWNISDESTSIFMQYFYHFRFENHLSKAKALQETQKIFIQAGKTSSHYPRYYAYPLHWAPFILIGNWL